MDIGKVRSSSRFVRVVASIVLITYSTLIVSPGVQAMQQADMQQRARDQALHAERSNFGKALQSAKQTLRVLADRPDLLSRKPGQEQRRAAKESLRAWRADTRALLSEIRSEFASTGELIERENLPEVIRQRHAEAVAKFEAEAAALDGEMSEALTTTDANLEKQKAEAALRRLDRATLGRSQQEFDPKQLPNGMLKPDRTRTPKISTEQFQAALLTDNSPVQFAQATGFDFSKLPGASNPSYLEATTEVSLSAAIVAKAAELNRDPVQIYNWVRNNIHWQPSWGALQDAEHTLSSQRGNAIDIASLTIALLRASGIPARYVYGTIDVPEDKFRNWAGGFQHVDAAMDFASAGGIPVVAVTSGGRTTKVRMEHVWVEAAIDFNPSRGAKNRSADSWIALDPSFKQIEILPGQDLAAIAGIDPEQLSAEFMASGEVNEAEGWMTGFDQTVIHSAQDRGQAAVEGHVAANLPDATVADVVGGRRILADNVPVLAASLPNRIVATGASFAAVPLSLQQRITFAFGKDIEGEPIDPRTFSWAQLNGRQVTLSFRPATQADEDALRPFLPSGEITDISQLPTSIPAYLIRVVPELKVDGTLVMSGAAMSLGTDVKFVFNPRFVSSGVQPFSYDVPAGSYLALAVVGGSVSPAQLSAASSRMQATRTILETNDQAQLARLTREQLMGDMFQAGLLNYYSQYTALSHTMGMKHRAYHLLAAGVGSFGYEPDVDSFFGVPRRIQGGGAVMNIPIVNVVGADVLSGTSRRDFAMQIGAMSSALEHRIPEELLTSANMPGEAISAVKALQKASAAGQRIYQITQANAAAVLPMIHHDPATMSEIQSALSAGRTVITHTDAVSVPGWHGAGYVLMDMETGAAAWKIAGGQNGSHITNWSALFMIFAVGVSAIGIIMLASMAAGAIMFTPLLAAVLISVGLHMLLLEGLFNPDHATWDDVAGPVKRIIGYVIGVLSGLATGSAAAILIVVEALEKWWS